jgi:hypothetical protein
MPVIPFPVGGRDMKHEELIVRSVPTIEAYRRLAEEHPEISDRLDRVLRTQQEGNCFISDDLEMSVFRLVGT